MSDEPTTVEETEEDIFASLLAEANISEEDLEDEVEVAEERFDQEEDKLSKKVRQSAEKKEKERLDILEQQILKQSVERFSEKADDIEKDLFYDVRADVKSVEDFDRVAKMVRERAAKLREREAAIMKAAEERAEEAAAKAWGTAPGSRAPEPSDEDKEAMKRIAMGDTKAGFAALMADDPFLGGKV